MGSHKLSDYGPERCATVMALLFLTLGIPGSLVFVSSSAGEESESVAYPLALDSRWTYHLHQELSEGMSFGEADAKIANGRVLDTVVIAEVTGTDTIDGETFVRVNSTRTGNPWLTEWYRLAPAGLLLGKTIDHESQQETLMVPPQRLLSSGLQAGESWEWQASDAPVHIRFEVIGAATVDVPAGVFESIEIFQDTTVTLEAYAISVRQSRWFVPGTGYVKQDTKMSVGDRVLNRTVLSLEKFEPVAGR